MWWKIFFIVCVIVGICGTIYAFVTIRKTANLYYTIQKLAQFYKDDFRYFVETEDGWKTYSSDEHNGDGCIKIIPNPEVTSLYFYYIKFDGPIPEERAIEYLIKGFIRYKKMRHGDDWFMFCEQYN